MKNKNFLSQVLSGFSNAGMGFMFAGYLIAFQGTTAYATYSAILILAAVLNLIESPLQQLLMRQVLNTQGPYSVKVYITEAIPIAAIVATVALIINLTIPLFAKYEILGQDEAIGSIISQIDQWTLFAATTAVLLISISSILSNSLIISGHIITDSIINPISILARYSATIIVLQANNSSAAPVTTTIYAILLGATLEIIVRATFMVRQMLNSQVYQRSYLVKSAIKQHKTDIPIILMPGVFSLLDRLISGAALNLNEFSIFIFVYTVTSASALITNSYIKTHLKNYWGQDGERSHVIVNLLSLTLAAPLLSASFAFIYFSLVTHPEQFPENAAALSVQATVAGLSGLMGGTTQFLYFKKQRDIWISFTAVRVGAYTLALLTSGALSYNTLEIVTFLNVLTIVFFIAKIISTR